MGADRNDAGENGDDVEDEVEGIAVGSPEKSFQTKNNKDQRNRHDPNCIRTNVQLETIWKKLFNHLSFKYIPCRPPAATALQFFF